MLCGREPNTASTPQDPHLNLAPARETRPDRSRRLRPSSPPREHGDHSQAWMRDNDAPSVPHQKPGLGTGVPLNVSGFWGNSSMPSRSTGPTPVAFDYITPGPSTLDGTLSSVSPQNTVSAAQRSGTASTTTFDTSSGVTVVRRDEAWYAGSADPVTYGLIYRGIRGKEEAGLRDPIGEGLITESQAEAAYQIFKYHFTAIFPHPRFLLCRKHFGSPKPLLPPPGSSDGLLSLSDVDPARMIGLAFGQMREMAHSLSLSRLLKSLESGIALRHLTDQLDDARLYLGVMTRQVWLSITRCPGSEIPATIGPTHVRILDLLRSSDQPCELDEYLHLEQSCLETVIDFARQANSLEQDLSPDVRRVREGNESAVWTTAKFVSVIDRARAQEPYMASFKYLACHFEYCKWWVTARNIWSIYRLPAPLFVDQMYDTCLQGLILAAQTSTQLLMACLRDKWDLASLPKAFGTAIVLCYLALSTGITYFRHYRPESHCLPPWTCPTLFPPFSLPSPRRIQELQRATESDPSDVTMPDQGGTVDLAELFGSLDNWWNWQMPWQGDLPWPSA
ncbi:hypothetical protein EHS25_008876 [Saitozyma podzolica]|uniref:Uncharacterized protein n=1 Tax=Saitozyma podzolica TaxID=1890683 RepID=A0A427YN29_9TREE|nr:hypothetical protein EHS25_008876 [Saitozyma podzolica]